MSEQEPGDSSEFGREIIEVASGGWGVGTGLLVATDIQTDVLLAMYAPTLQIGYLARIDMGKSGSERRSVLDEIICATRVTAHDYREDYVWLAGAALLSAGVAGETQQVYAEEVLYERDLVLRCLVDAGFSYFNTSEQWLGVDEHAASAALYVPKGTFTVSRT